MKQAILISLLAITLNACSSIDPNPMQEYLSLAPVDASAMKTKRIQGFSKLFDQLETLKLEDQVAATYAENLYFNDTVVTLHDRQRLIKYLKHTQQQLETINFEVLSCLNKGNDSFVRWRMQTRFTVLTQTLTINSIGMSHLRFDEHNKIILHQDYWDSMQGFYQHLPIIGGVLRWIRSALYTQ